MENTEKKYIHDEFHHNLKSPEIIINKLLKYISPKSVVDVGCGIGTFLKVFKDNGITEILGIDGNWVDKNLLYKYIQENEFFEANLEKPLFLSKKFDLAISLEVAEHIEENKSDIFIKSLTSLSDIIVFSAAFPNQGGQNHVNEQWPEYWSNKFNKYGYHMFDVIRPLIWNESEVQSWYKQNIFLVLNENKKQILNNFPHSLTDEVAKYNIIHPDYYNALFEYPSKFYEQLNINSDFLKGHNNTELYIKVLIKNIMYKLKIRK